MNKGELRNSLARAIRFYRLGSVGDRDPEEQQRKASTPVPEHVLAHLSPLAWEHITLSGIYRWRRYTSNFGALRSLRSVRTAPGTPPSAQAG